MIGIKDRTMPTECEYCPLCRFYRESGRVWCNAKNRILKLEWKYPDYTYLNVPKPDWCPLVDLSQYEDDLK